MCHKVQLHMLNSCSRKTAHELPKSDLQDEFGGINVSYISPTVFKKTNKNDFKFLGKKKSHH